MLDEEQKSIYEGSIKIGEPEPKSELDVKKDDPLGHVIDSKSLKTSNNNIVENEFSVITNDEFSCKRKTIEMFSQLVSASDRAKTNVWLLKIDSCEDYQLRLAYIKFLLHVVAGGHLVEPFSRIPPDTPLKPLNEIVDPNLLIGLTRDKSIMDTAQLFTPRRPPTKIVDKTFYNYQLKPRDGTLCYAAAFSFP